MPTSDMLSVRGIGVALIVSTSTFFRSCLIFSLCETPNRCLKIRLKCLQHANRAVIFRQLKGSCSDRCFGKALNRFPGVIVWNDCSAIRNLRMVDEEAGRSIRPIILERLE